MDASICKPCNNKDKNVIAVDATRASAREEDASILEPCNRDMNAHAVDVTGASVREEDVLISKPCNKDLNSYSVIVSEASSAGAYTCKLYYLKDISRKMLKSWCLYDEVLGVFW